MAIRSWRRPNARPTALRTTNDAAIADDSAVAPRRTQRRDADAASRPPDAVRPRLSLVASAECRLCLRAREAERAKLAVAALFGCPADLDACKRGLPARAALVSELSVHGRARTRTRRPRRSRITRRVQLAAGRK